MYEKLFSPENLFQAFDEFKRGKRKKKDVMEFEYHLEENIFELSQDVLSGTYQHGGYMRFYVWDPKFRIIHKASVRDRLVHHVVFGHLYKVFDKHFIDHSYSSRIDKGTHRGMEKLYCIARKVSRNFTRNAYVLKCDIRKFFASIDHEILLNLVRKKVVDEKMMKLITLIVESFNTHTHTHTRKSGIWHSAG